MYAFLREGIGGSDGRAKEPKANQTKAPPPITYTDRLYASLFVHEAVFILPSQLVSSWMRRTALNFLAFYGSQAELFAVLST